MAGPVQVRYKTRISKNSINLPGLPVTRATHQNQVEIFFFLNITSLAASIISFYLWVFFLSSALAGEPWQQVLITNTIWLYTLFWLLVVLVCVWSWHMQSFIWNTTRFHSFTDDNISSVYNSFTNENRRRLSFCQ